MLAPKRRLPARFLTFRHSERNVAAEKRSGEGGGAAYLLFNLRAGEINYAQKEFEKEGGKEGEGLLLTQFSRQEERTLSLTLA